jgi:hypothetical protein
MSDSYFSHSRSHQIFILNRMAFHLKNLKIQKPKFFESLTSSQLCAIVQDGEIMNYINTVPIRRNELESIFQNIGTICNPKTLMAPGPRQKQVVVHVKLLAEIVKQWEAGKGKYYTNLQSAQKTKNNSEKLASNAQAEANRKASENLQKQMNAQKAANAAREAETAAIAAANSQVKVAEDTLGLAAATLPIHTNVSLQKQLMNLKKNMNSMSMKLNNLLNTTRKNNASAAPAARRGGKRTRKH